MHANPDLERLVSTHPVNRNRFLLALVAGTLALAASPEALGQAKITRLHPGSLPAGSKDQTVQVYGSGFSVSEEKIQHIWVNCVDHEAQAYPWGKDKLALVILHEKDLEKEGKLPFSTEKCSAENVPPRGTVYLTVEKPREFKDMAPFGEALVGVDVSAASSVSPGAEFLLLGIMDIPIGSNVEISHETPAKPGRFWLSGQLGLKGMAQPGSISGATSSSYYAPAANATPDKIVQSVDISFHVGMELFGWHNTMATFDIPPPVDATSETNKSGSPTAGIHEGTIATVSLIFGGGAVTPLSFSQSNPQVYEATPLILQQETPISPTKSFAPSCSANPTQTPTCYVIFVPSDRTHFYRSYDAGLRLKLYAFDNKAKSLRFPAILDLTIGQNEYVTGGFFHGAVTHIGGLFPIPRADSFYFFGSVDMGASFVNGGGPQLQLIPAPATAGVTASSPSVYTISTAQPNRDRYQFGFGIDVIHLFVGLAEDKRKKQQNQ